MKNFFIIILIICLILTAVLYLQYFDMKNKADTLQNHENMNDISKKENSEDKIQNNYIDEKTLYYKINSNEFKMDEISNEGIFTVEMSVNDKLELAMTELATVTYDWIINIENTDMLILESEKHRIKVEGLSEPYDPYKRGEKLDGGGDEKAQFILTAKESGTCEIDFKFISTVNENVTDGFNFTLKVVILPVE